MTKNGWCRTNYHADGKRRWGNLTNGLCNECSLSLTSKEAEKITQCQEKINDLEFERCSLNNEIDRLRSKLQTLINSLQKSGVAK
jgi:predicted nuclease with TOPRIM domain